MKKNDIKVSFQQETPCWSKMSKKERESLDFLMSKGWVVYGAVDVKATWKQEKK